MKTTNGKSVLDTPRYAAFLGWLLNIKTKTQLYDEIISTGEMTFMCTFKLSQDPLENFFHLLEWHVVSTITPQQYSSKVPFIIFCATVLTERCVCVLIILIDII